MRPEEWAGAKGEEDCSMRGELPEGKRAAGGEENCQRGGKWSSMQNSGCKTSPRKFPFNDACPTPIPIAPAPLQPIRPTFQPAAVRAGENTIYIGLGGLHFFFARFR